jgi:hypothetical protein
MMASNERCLVEIWNKCHSSGYCEGCSDYKINCMGCRINMKKSRVDRR